MRAERFLFLVGIALTTQIYRPAMAQTPAALTDLRARAALVKPTAAELKWQQIPWMLDLAQGQQVAKQERRPIFLWVTGDDPLERC